MTVLSMLMSMSASVLDVFASQICEALYHDVYRSGFNEGRVVRVAYLEGPAALYSCPARVNCLHKLIKHEYEE